MSYFWTKVCLNLLWIQPWVPVLCQAHTKCSVSGVHCLSKDKIINQSHKVLMVENQAFHPGGEDLRSLPGVMEWRAPWNGHCLSSRRPSPSPWSSSPVSGRLGIQPSSFSVKQLHDLGVFPSKPGCTVLPALPQWSTGLLHWRLELQYRGEGSINSREKGA